MTEKSLEVPPFKVAAAILRKTTERLGHEVVTPSDTAPEWNELEWAIARASAAMQGISTLLANRLRWKGPPEWQSFLTEQKRQSILCHQRIGTVMERLDVALRAAGIPALAMKGAALRAFDYYSPGERPMGDIDLLVRPEELDAVSDVLHELDYELAYSKRRHEVFAPRQKSEPHMYGEHIDNPLRIEVHTMVAEPLPVREVDITEDIWNTEATPGLNPYPRPAALLLHIMLHASGNMRAHALRQIQLLDIASLAQLLSAESWLRLLRAGNTQDGAWWAYPALALCERYSPGSIPAEVLRAARSACPRILRGVSERQNLTDVSWSNLRIYAFPGIRWARTPWEALRFMRSRLLPNRTELGELRFTRKAQPHLFQVPWYGVSHLNRMIRWIFSRPPRVQTMLVLNATLESSSA